MKLKDDFYHIQSAQDSEQGVEYRIALNPEHFIYRAHFPGNPVTPGVCLLQMCKELLELRLASTLVLSRMVNVKYLAVVNPNENPLIRFILSRITTTDDGYKCAVLIHSLADAPFAKLSLVFRHDSPTLDRQMSDLGLCVVIPTYNHAVFLEDLLEDLLRYTSHIIIVDDGSTDRTPRILVRYADRITILSLPRNKGKGDALRQGMSKARAMGYRNVVTMDSDGQHKPSDLPFFIEAAAAHPRSMIIGSRSFHEENMPAGNKFANRLSNFWFAVQSGRCLPDTQCGYRLYPLAEMQGMTLLTSRYEAELEWLLRLAWKNVPLIALPVHVGYLPKGERISHYRRATDFLRISLLNAVMFFAAVFYGYPSRVVRKIRGRG